MTWKKNSLHREEDESIWENANGWIITCSLNYPVLNRVVFKQIPIGSCQKADIPKCHLVDTDRSSGTEILNQKKYWYLKGVFFNYKFELQEECQKVYILGQSEKAKQWTYRGGRGESEANTDLLRLTFRVTAMLCSSGRKILFKTWL